MTTLLGKVIRIAHENPETREHLIPVIREAMEFDTPRALEKYLKNHPKADRSKHKVKQKGDSGGKSEKPLGAKGGPAGKKAQKAWKSVHDTLGKIQDTVRDRTVIHGELNRAHHSGDKEGAKELEKKLTPKAKVLYEKSLDMAKEMVKHGETVLGEIDRDSLDESGKRSYDEAKQRMDTAKDRISSGVHPREGYEASDYNYMAGLVADSTVSPMQSVYEIMQNAKK